MSVVYCTISKVFAPEIPWGVIWPDLKRVTDICNHSRWWYRCRYERKVGHISSRARMDYLATEEQQWTTAVDKVMLVYCCCKQYCAMFCLHWCVCICALLVRDRLWTDMGNWLRNLQANAHRLCLLSWEVSKVFLSHHNTMAWEIRLWQCTIGYQ